MQQGRKIQLFDVPQALGLLVVDQLQHQRLRHGDETVDRVIEDLHSPLLHFAVYEW